MTEPQKRLVKLAIGGGVVVVFVAVAVAMFADSKDHSEADLESDDPTKRMAALSALGKERTESAGDTVAQYMSDSDTRVAAHAVYTLGRMQDKRHLKQLKQTLTDNRPALREAAVVAVARINAREDPKPVVDTLKRDESSKVRAAAASALGQEFVIDAVPQLVDALSDPSEQVRRKAISAINRILGRKINYDPAASPNSPKNKASIALIKASVDGMRSVVNDHVKLRERDPNQR